MLPLLIQISPHTSKCDDTCHMYSSVRVGLLQAAPVFWCFLLYSPWNIIHIQCTFICCLEWHHHGKTLFCIVFLKKMPYLKWSTTDKWSFSVVNEYCAQLINKIFVVMLTTYQLHRQHAVQVGRKWPSSVNKIYKAMWIQIHILVRYEQK